MSIGRILSPLVVGGPGALTSGPVGFLVFPRSLLTSAWLTVGTPLGSALAAIVPGRVIYWIDPEGGPRAFLGLVLVGSLLTWSGLIALSCVGILGWYRRSRPSV